MNISQNVTFWRLTMTEHDIDTASNLRVVGHVLLHCVRIHPILAYRQTKTAQVSVTFGVLHGSLKYPGTGIYQNPIWRNEHVQKQN